MKINFENRQTHVIFYILSINYSTLTKKQHDKAEDLKH